MGAVINEGSMKSILDYIEVGKKDGRLITGGGPATNAGEGFFLQPTVIADIPAKSRLEQEEIFGPVLAVIKAKNYDHALEIANDTEFGLTGAVYTKSREKIERAIREFHVGNLYINRKCTGARLERTLSAGSICQARIPSPVARIICTCLPRAKQSGKKVSRDW